jgi:hypothetical protein
MSARHLGALNLVGIIQKHAPKDWKAAAWLLERQHSAIYGKKEKVEHEMTAEIHHTVMTEERIKELVEKKRAAMAKRMGK